MVCSAAYITSLSLPPLYYVREKRRERERERRERREEKREEKRKSTSCTASLASCLIKQQEKCLPPLPASCLPVCRLSKRAYQVLLFSAAIA